MELNSLVEAREKILGKTGKQLLSEEEILILAAYEISKTYTREEKQYSA